MKYWILIGIKADTCEMEMCPVVLDLRKDGHRVMVVSFDQKY